MNTDGFQPFLIFSSPWEQVAVFFSFFFFLFLPPSPTPLCSVALFLKSLFSPLHHGSHLIWGGVP